MMFAVLRIFLGFCILLCIYKILKPGKKKLMEQAEKNGCKTVGILKNSRIYQDSRYAWMQNSRVYIAAYEYEVNGKKYKKDIVFRQADVPEKLVIYYDSADPKKNVSVYELPKTHVWRKALVWVILLLLLTAGMLSSVWKIDNIIRKIYGL